MPEPTAVSRVWLDEGEVSPRWSAPSTPVRGRPLPPGAAWGLVAAALAGLLVLTWALGGFERRTDLLRATPVGTLVSTGPYELRFTGATAQQRTTYDDRVVWRVTAVGEGRTTGDVTIAPDHSGDDGMFVAKDVASGEVRTPETQSFRPGGFVSSEAFTPGLPLQPFRVEFEFPRTYQPGDTLSFVVFDLEFRDSSLLGDQEPQWRNADAGSRFELPVEVLPPATS
ncbi:hypothetical protein SAMN04488543_4324 [Friedmanniella luteola]|uniref:Uncharacterized protein n=1 Tax=Friedmanniella luteola TaxID=546871 RepID=A0A1H2A9V1_9ACTN|nr:hypothetical protein [Friedmanniella luteola]SDT42657.1 hypothetical protein SAMN04488543_4324 [Friedmanniella luteola]